MQGPANASDQTRSIMGGPMTKTALLKSVSTISLGALAMSLATVAHAQVGNQGPVEEGQTSEEQGDENSVLQGDEIIVRGFRDQFISAINSKEDADGVADFLVADDLGRLPDMNLADSLRRLPGVTTEFDEDEGRFVSIRGLPSRYTFVALNGALIPDGWFASDRRQNIEAVPNFVVKRAGVYKTLTPDIDGNAIGGYVENELRSGFDQAGFNLAGQVQIGYHTNTDTPGGPGNPSPRIQLRASTQFGSDDQFAILLSGEFFDKNRDQTKDLRQIRYESDGTPYVFRIEALDYTNKIRRWSALGRLEFKPNDTFYTAVTASHFDYQYDEFRYFLRLDGRGSRTTGPDGGSYPRGRAEIILDRFPIGTETDFIMWDAKLTPDDEVTLTSNFTWGEGRYTLPVDENSINFRTGDLDALGYSYDFTGQNEGDRVLAPVTFNDASALLNLDDYNFVGDFWPRVDRQKQTIWQFRSDLEYDPVDSGFLAKAGVQWRNLEASQDLTRNEFYSLASGVSLAPTQFARSEELINPGLGVQTPFINPVAFTDYFRANPDDFVLNDRDGIESLRADYNYDEDIYAAYGLVGFVGDNFRIKGGVRVEHTDFRTRQFRRFGNELEPTSSSGSYTDVLPSVVASFGLADGLILRAGYSKSIGRPNPDDISQGEIRSDPNEESEIRIRRGNPNLQPRKADSYDIALEYYFAPGSLISAGYFRKEIRNEIFTRREEELVGDTLFIFTQPTNATDATVQGVEVTFSIDRFDFLPGPLADFGLFSNFTWLDGELDVLMSDESIRTINTLPGAADFRANVTLLYESGPVEGNLTYAHRSDQRVNINTGNALADRFEKAYDQLDFQLRYNFSDRFNVFVQGRNILDNPRLFAEGPDADIFREVNDFGASYWLGVNFKL